MCNWHHDWRIDAGLRLGGAALCGLSWLAIQGLAALHLAQAHASAGGGAFALALAAFLCASPGAVLLFLGRHVFDQVSVSARWRGEPRPEEERLPESVADEIGDGGRLLCSFIDEDDQSAFTIIRRA